MRIFIDTFVLRRPPAGTARWVNGLVGSLRERRDLQLTLGRGPRRIGSGWPYRIPNMLAERWWYERGTRAAARRARSDIMLMPANYAARRGVLPQVVTILDVNFLTQPGTYEPLFAKYATWAFRRAARDADAITTVSEFSRSEIIRYLNAEPAKITVVHPGLGPPHDGPPAPRPLADRYALYVGATEVHKNVGLLLDAWTGFNTPGGLHLAIVGQPGRAHAAITERAASTRGRVVVRGSVSQAELEAWYRHADAFVFPSRTEGFGFPPLDAMRRGIPVVASSAGALPEVLGAAALFHDPSDPSMLRDHVARLVEDSTLRHEMINRGYANAARYTWAATSDRITHLLDTVLSRRQSVDPNDPPIA